MKKARDWKLEWWTYSWKRSWSESGQAYKKERKKFPFFPDLLRTLYIFCKEDSLDFNAMFLELSTHLNDLLLSKEHLEIFVPSL